jgi:hypothetical protein
VCVESRKKRTQDVNYEQYLFGNKVLYFINRRFEYSIIEEIIFEANLSFGAPDAAVAFEIPTVVPSLDLGESALVAPLDESAIVAPLDESAMVAPLDESAMVGPLKLEASPVEMSPLAPH